FAHQRGCLHGDIKPSNVLMPSPGVPMLADFSIASLIREDQHLTVSSTIVGTAAYMAPEQATRHNVDARTDLYAAGIMLYALLTRHVPFEADRPLDILIKHVYEPPRPPRSLNAALPEEAEALLMRALAKRPADRYQSAAEMAETLIEIAAGAEPGLMPELHA